MTRPGARTLVGLRDVSIGALAAAALLLASPDVAAASALLALLTLPIAFALGVRPDAEARSLLWIFLAAVGVRATLALLDEWIGSVGFFAMDDFRYAELGWALARHWAGELPAPVGIYGPAGYYRWNALLFTLLGFVPLAAAFANAAISGVCVLLTYAMARDIGGPRAARLAALGMAFWPSIVLWTSLNLKDAAALLAILLLLRGAQRLQVERAPTAWLMLAGGFLLLSELRNYLVWIAAAAIGLSMLATRLRVAPLPTVIAMVLAAVVLPELGPLEELRAETSLETLDRTRRELAYGGSAYLRDADLSTPWGAIRFLPLGLAYFLLAPAPWQLANTRQLLTLPEMLVWYALIPILLRGLFFALRERLVASLPLAGFAFLATLSYAMVEGNLGTAYRHRAQVMVLFLVFAAVGMARRRAPAPSSNPLPQGVLA